MRLVCYYADNVTDENMAKNLLVHLQRIVAEGLISLTSPQSLVAGDDKEERLKDFVNQAEIILLLLSPDFFGDRIAMTIMHLTRKRHEDEKIRVIPIILRQCWLESERWISNLVLPSAPSQNNVWTDSDYNTTRSVRKVVLELRNRKMVEEGKKQFAAGDLNAALTTYTKARDDYDDELEKPVGDLALLEDIRQGIRDVQVALVREMVEEGKKGDLNAALTTYQEALDLNQAQNLHVDQALLDEIYWGMGDAFFAGNEKGRAWESYEQALHKEGGKELARDEKWQALGRACEEQNRQEQALEAYEQAIKEDPGNASCHFAKGRVLLAFTGDLKGALDAYALAAKLDPRFAPRPVSRGARGARFLSECIVQIIFNEDIKGEGFFVAPGVILTTVPAPFSDFSEVPGSNLEIIWPGGNLEILSTLPKRGLALCYVNQRMKDHPNPYLSLSENVQSFDSTYCYLPSSPSDLPNLTVLGFEEDSDTERIVLDAADDATDSISGTPLIHSQTGSVCGIMAQSHTGAWQAKNAISIRTVLEAFKELALLHTETKVKTTSIVIAYASKDANLFDRLFKEVQKQQSGFRNLRFYWNSLLVPDPLSAQRVRGVEEARFFLFLISSDFFTSDNLWKSYILRALERQQGRDAEIIPIFLRRPDPAVRANPGITLSMARFDALQELPKNGLPATEWKKPEEAFKAIVKDIIEVLQLPEKPADFYLESRYTKACRIFYSYADEDAGWVLPLKEELKQKRLGQMLTWQRGQIIAGSDKKYEIHRHLEAAQIIRIRQSMNWKGNMHMQSSNGGRKIFRS